MSRVVEDEKIRCDVCGVVGVMYRLGGPFYPSHGTVTVTAGSVAYNGDVGGATRTYKDICSACLRRVEAALQHAAEEPQ